jgi:hypothetical protein
LVPCFDVVALSPIDKFMETNGKKAKGKGYQNDIFIRNFAYISEERQILTNRFLFDDPASLKTSLGKVGGPCAQNGGAAPAIL